jgi:hypothetical protein
MTSVRTLAIVAACFAWAGCSNNDAGTGTQPQTDGGGASPIDGGNAQSDATTSDATASDATVSDASDAAALQDAEPDGDVGGDASDAGPTACPYPAGPYGVLVGSVIDPKLAWQGYAPNAALPSTIQVKDFFDCDGSKGINALLLDTAAEWCAPCVNQANDTVTDMKGTWGADGVQVIELLAQDSQGGPATVPDALKWEKARGLTMINVVADPAYSLAQSPDAGFPANVLVDPRTMKVVSASEGYTGVDPGVDALAKQNASGDPQDAGAE